MKKGALLVIILVLLSFSVFAQEDDPLAGQAMFDQSKTVGWLVNNTGGNLDIEELSFAIAALNKAGRRSEVAGLLTRLNEIKDPELGCFPAAACTTKETAVATLALGATGNDITQQLEWLKTTLTSFGGGEWHIQIEGVGDGECVVEYPIGVGDQTQTKSYSLDDNIIEGAQGKYSINIERDLNGGIVNMMTSATINVDCTQLQTAVISLIYKSGNNWHILSEKNGRGSFVVSNACFAANDLGGNCHYDASLYSAWVIKEVAGTAKLEEYGVKTYLQSEERNDDLARAMLARTFGEKAYLQELSQTQDATGAWGNGDPFTTAMAVFALQGYSESESFAKGRERLETTVSMNGAWYEKVKDTSMGLIAMMGGDFGRAAGGSSSVVPMTGGAAGTSNNEICDNLFDDDGDSFIDCGDGDCATFDDCRCENQVLDPGEEGVDCGGICDKGCSVDELPTPIDPAFPEDPGGDSDFPSFDEEEEEGSSWWIWVLVLIVAIALGVFIFMKYKAGGISLKRKPKTSFEQYKRQIAQRPAPARRPPVRRTSAPVRKPIGRAKLRSKDEDELDKSLKEAEKLLKGGK